MELHELKQNPYLWIPILFVLLAFLGAVYAGVFQSQPGKHHDPLAKKGKGKWKKVVTRSLRGLPTTAYSVGQQSVSGLVRLVRKVAR